jgi:peroxiredoxin Q/BCP
MTVEEGDVAPAFSLAAVGGGEVSLEGLRGKVVVLYFYPKDDTPGCTKEACDFRDAWGELEAAGAVVVGVSPDGVGDHEKFRKKYGLPFTLLADPGHAVAERYGVWKEKINYGKKYMGIERTTFVIDPAGKVVKVFRRVRVEGHVGRVVEVVKGGRGEGTKALRH